MQRKVLFIDTAHPSLQDLLEQMGFDCDHFPDAKFQDYLVLIKDYTGLVVRSKIPIHEPLLKQAVKLKFIARVGAGMENIDVASAHKRDIVCINAPEGNRDAVAEHAMGMLLALLNNLLVADREVRGGIWRREQNRGTELGGKTVGIIGYGNTGSAFAHRLSGFDVKILAYDKYKSGFSTDFVKESDMEQIFNESDVLSLHVPLTEETSWLVDKAYINRFVKPFYLINTSRGKVVNTIDLVESLKAGKILGACLDVLEYEKSTFEKLNVDQLPATYLQLASMNNVILSPHIAGWTVESAIKMAQVLARKISDLDNL